MGKVQAPSALDNYFINRGDYDVQRLPSMEERAGSYAKDYGVSYEEAVQHFKDFDAHYYHRSDD